MTKTVQIADFIQDQNEYISTAQEGNLFATVKLSSQLGNSYLDTMEIGKVGGGRLGSRQEQRARALRNELLAQVKTAVVKARWQISDSLGFTAYKSPLRNAVLRKSVTPSKATQPTAKPVPYQEGNAHVQDSVTTLPKKDGSRQEITVGTYTRTITTKSITFRCAHCGNTVTQERYPSRKPMYCTDTCKKEVEKEQTRLRVQRLRASRKKASQIG